MALSKELLALLRCPVTGQTLTWESDQTLVTPDGGRRYPLTASGIPQFGLDDVASAEAVVQQHHYDGMDPAYLENFSYPHTQVYLDYLDGEMEKLFVGDRLGVTAEVCCGPGEGCRLFHDRASLMFGIDISLRVLEHAQAHLGEKCAFLQGDATHLPLMDGCLDTVMLLGGIHHVNDRLGLFREVHRVLKPGGRVYWREPARDLFLWRWISTVIYKLSPLLDDATERPLRFLETVPPLQEAGLILEAWRTKGFFGFCLFMNSDVLIFPRVFRFIPGIRAITRFFTWLDERCTNLPGLERGGLIVVGRAVKPLTREGP